MPGFELFGDEERKEVNDVMAHGVLMRYGFDAQRKGSWKSKELEAEICKSFGCKYAQLTSSGTSALTTAMHALGIGYGDEVIMPSFTFVASFESILSVGAVPVMVDVDDTLTLDPKAVEKAITLKTKCVMPVHMCGSPADLDALKAICDKHKLILLEDACQAIGATFKGKSVGNIGVVAAFSFDYVKTMTCGEGGVVITNDKDIYVKCDGYSDHGHDHLGADRGADQHPFMGYNYRIGELNSAIGLAQIRRLDKVLKLQHRNSTIIREALSKVDGVTFRRIPVGGGENASFLSFFLPSEEKARKVTQEFKDKGIAGNFYWYDNNWHYIRKWDHLKQAISLAPLAPELKEKVMKNVTGTFAPSDEIMKRCISSSISVLWTEEQVHARAKVMAEAILTHSTAKVW